MKNPFFPRRRHILNTINLQAFFGLNLIQAVAVWNLFEYILCAYDFNFKQLCGLERPIHVLSPSCM